MQIQLSLATRDDAENVLTDRERQVLRLIALGRTDVQIADELFIARYTASNHVARILGKLCLPNRTAAAAYAARNGIV